MFLNQAQNILSYLFAGVGALGFMEFLKDTDNIALLGSSIFGSIFFIISSVIKLKESKLRRDKMKEELKKLKRENEENKTN